MPLLLALLLLPDAQAGWPEDVAPSTMDELGGVREFDRDLLRDSWTQLVKELGTMVANKPVNPTATTGIYGWEVSMYTQFVMTEGRDRGDDPSPWMRVHPEEDPQPWHVVPTLGVRKGLPLSTEVGANVGWIGRTRTGTVGGYARVAILENTQPWPDITLQAGYAGYIGNEELQLGVLDLGVSMGTTWFTGMMPGAHNAAVSPWVSFSSLRVHANPTLDDDTLDRVGAVGFRKARSPEDDALAPLILPQIGGGIQIVSRNVHARIAATWAPATIPTLSTGMGVTF